MGTLSGYIYLSQFFGISSKFWHLLQHWIQVYGENTHGYLEMDCQQTQKDRSPQKYIPNGLVQGRLYKHMLSHLYPLKIPGNK